MTAASRHLSVTGAEIATSTDPLALIANSRGYRHSLDVETDIPVVFHGGRPYATFRSHTRIRLTIDDASDNEHLPAADDPRVVTHTQTFELGPAGVRNVTIKVPIGHFGRQERVQLQALPVILERDAPPIVIENHIAASDPPVINIEPSPVVIEGLPPRTITIERDRKTGQLKGATVEDA